MDYAVGSLVKARGREWVVQPGSDEEVIRVRPIGGSPEEETGLLYALEGADITPAQFALPAINQLGDYRSCKLLRDAVRINTRSGAGPFRSLARIAVEPRPYQLVPLLLALKQDPVRLLVADDVGVGKTIESCMIVRELIDRGEIKSFAVLCPPHLADQWQRELNDKFHLDSELVLPATIARLERGLPQHISVFDHYSRMVISMDFIKSEKKRNDFISRAPELVVVDEAHTCATGYEGRASHHYRHELVKALVDKANTNGEIRHLILVTATPHSGKDQAFRSLLALLNEDFQKLPDNLGGQENEALRRRLAGHFVQRRRANLERFVGVNTPFPKRESKEEDYHLTQEYQTFFDKILEYASEKVRSEETDQRRKRLNWWSALALLRSLASSPAAAAATLRSRAKVADEESVEDIEEVGRQSVLDVQTEDKNEGVDLSPGADISGKKDDEKAITDPRLAKLAKEAESLRGEKDAKLQKAVKMVKVLVDEGFQPIVFCRFIATASYVAEELSHRLSKSVEVTCVTGELSPAEREEKVLAMESHGKRVLVATDCLSEGINLQELFNAVIHYDLSWNPTRHEQRDGRVDRFGQAHSPVRIITYYGHNNPVDGMVLQVLLKKHEEIRKKTGVGVPVPRDSEAVMDAILEGLLLREKQSGDHQNFLPGLESVWKPKAEGFHRQWEEAGEKEKALRSMFAQESIRVEELQSELEASRAAVGSSLDVEDFTRAALEMHGGLVRDKKNHVVLDLNELPQELKDSLRDALGSTDSQVAARFDLPLTDGVRHLSRTNPFVENLASFCMDTALDSLASAKAQRCGVIQSKAVAKRTTVLLTRFRFDLTTVFKDRQESQISEETGVLAFEGAPEEAVWMDAGTSEGLLDAKPSSNVDGKRAEVFLQKVVEGHKALIPKLEEEAKQRAKALQAAHSRVRTVSKQKGLAYKVREQLPVDILGIYVILPHTSQ
jgi:superfamily II DNA or RNA helicase